MQSVSGSAACAYGCAPAPWDPPDSSSVDVNHSYVPGSNPSSTTGLQCDLGRAINSPPYLPDRANKKGKKAPSFTRALGEEAERAHKHQEPCEKHCRKKKKILTKAITAALPRLYFRRGFIRSSAFFAIARAGGHRPRKRGKVWAFGHAEFLPCPTAGLSGLGSWGGIEGGRWCPVIPGALPCRDPEEESRTPGAGGREERGRKGEKGKKKSPPSPLPSLQIYHRNPIWAPAFPCKPLLFTK